MSSYEVHPRIHWGRILVAGFLAELSVFVVFFLLLFLAWLAGFPNWRRPPSPLDYIDALVASFASIFFFTLWVSKRIESGFVLHGTLIGARGNAAVPDGAHGRERIDRAADSATGSLTG